MGIRIFLILAGFLIISGCGQETLNEQHKQNLSSRGWEIKESIEVKTYILDNPNERLSGFEASGITFLRDYLGEEVTRYVYMLKEKDIDGKRLKAEVFKAEEEIIGGYGLLPSWTPGIFNLNNKEHLINEKMIKP